MFSDQLFQHSWQQVKRTTSVVCDAVVVKVNSAHELDGIGRKIVVLVVIGGVAADADAGDGDYVDVAD